MLLQSLKLRDFRGVESDRSDASGELIGLTLIDVRRLLDEAADGQLRIELPATARTDELELALAS
jgi:hypothetical protein